MVCVSRLHLPHPHWTACNKLPVPRVYEEEAGAETAAGAVPGAQAAGPEAEVQEEEDPDLALARRLQQEEDEEAYRRQMELYGGKYSGMLACVLCVSSSGCAVQSESLLGPTAYVHKNVAMSESKKLLPDLAHNHLCCGPCTAGALQEPAEAVDVDALDYGVGCDAALLHDHAIVH